LTVLAGLGPNIALQSSSFVTPPDPCADANHGDAIVWCINLGTGEKPIHAGDRLPQVRVAAGWTF
jgi:hypothetical protein